MVNVDSGEIAYAVLSFGGLLGLGDKLFAVPWKSLTVNEKEKCFVLPVKKEHLEHAPGFNKNSWPDQEDPNWEDKVKKYYNCDKGCDETDGNV